MKKLQCVGLLGAVLVLGLLGTEAQPQGFCVIDIDAPPNTFKPPFLIDPVAQLVQYPIVYNGGRALIIPQGVTWVVACPGITNSFKNDLSKTSIDVTCDAGQLKIGPYVIGWGQLGCLRIPVASLIKIPNSPCSMAGSEYAIRWDIRTNFFLDQVKICFNEYDETTEFTIHEIQGSSIGIRSVPQSRPAFTASPNMFSVNVKIDYKKTSQMALFTSLLGTNQHLTGVGEHYLARGHLAPDGDFVYIAEQRATYLYANAAPQWQSLNNGNWKKLEYAIRKLAENHQVKLVIFTGTYDVLQFPNINTNQITDMFLGLIQGKKVIPVPAVMWKVIYDPVQHRAVAVFSINEFKLDGTSEVIRKMQNNPPPFNDVCNQITWIIWNTKDINGPTFCSDVNDLSSLIPILPNLGPVGLLTT